MQKIVILLRENAVFYKIDILAVKWQPMKNIKNIEKKCVKINFVDFFLILEPTWVDFGFPAGLQKTGFF